mmetsp:Transcript_102889/g.331947  ORF Transcript_102889/g.331947 Transcript_102889/m.331947 type:complete len:232 (+) Transcript_102889:130-825(+)
MYPTSYAPDGTGRDIGIYHHGTRTSGMAGHIGARDSALVHPRLTKGRENRQCGTYFPAVGAMATQPLSKIATPREGPNPWSKSTYSSTYRDHHSDPAAADFQARHDDCNSVRAIMFGTANLTPRQPPPRSMVQRSTYRGHFTHGAEPELPEGYVARHGTSGAIPRQPVPSLFPRSTYRAHFTHGTNPEQREGAPAAAETGWSLAGPASGPAQSSAPALEHEFNDGVPGEFS